MLLRSIRNESTNPFFNLALEEYVIKYLDPSEDYIILWQNCPSVIIGRNQNTVEEINQQYVKENNINVVRRLSGGGAVYHDLGNLNFTFITNKDEGQGPDFRKFTLPVIKALAKLGVKAELSGRNDLVIDGKKFSGNAQYFYQNRVLHHGTILYDSDLDVVQKVLNVKAEKIASKGIKSVRSRVTNIKEYLATDLSVLEFKELLLKTLLEEEDEQEELILTDQDRVKIEEIMQKRYATWEWNYGQSPPFNFKKSQRFSGGNIEVRLDIRKGIIESCKIYGDFFGTKEVQDFEKLFLGVPYREEDINKIIDDAPTQQFFSNITKEELKACFF